MAGPPLRFLSRQKRHCRQSSSAGARPPGSRGGTLTFASRASLIVRWATPSGARYTQCLLWAPPGYCGPIRQPAAEAPSHSFLSTSSAFTISLSCHDGRRVPCSEPEHPLDLLGLARRRRAVPLAGGHLPERRPEAAHVVSRVARVASSIRVLLCRRHRAAPLARRVPHVLLHLLLLRRRLALLLLALDLLLLLRLLHLVVVALDLDAADAAAADAEIVDRDLFVRGGRRPPVVVAGVGERRLLGARVGAEVDAPAVDLHLRAEAVEVLRVVRDADVAAAPALGDRELETLRRRRRQRERRRLRRRHARRRQLRRRRVDDSRPRQPRRGALAAVQSFGLESLAGARRARARRRQLLRLRPRWAAAADGAPPAARCAGTKGTRRSILRRSRARRRRRTRRETSCRIHRTPPSPAADRTPSGRRTAASHTAASHRRRQHRSRRTGGARPPPPRPSRARRGRTAARRPTPPRRRRRGAAPTRRSRPRARGARRGAAARTPHDRRSKSRASTGRRPTASRGRRAAAAAARRGRARRSPSTGAASSRARRRRPRFPSSSRTAERPSRRAPLPSQSSAHSGSGSAGRYS